jgi:hypothetical protein
MKGFIESALLGALAAVALFATPARGATAPAPAPPVTADAWIPIVFNDHHVYAKPDRLRSGRVLAALARGGTILVPLRSLFEAMGASVSYDRATRTVQVTKPGARVTLTVGEPRVTVNGETRPLDVPPEIDDGSVLVPLRVISEGMGAYVLWLPEKRVVVVRYLTAPAPSPPPAPEPTAAGSVAPAPSPSAPPSATPAPKEKVKRRSERFVVGDYLFAPKVYNELSPGNTGHSSFRLAAAAEFPLFNIPWMLAGDFRSFRYPHNGGSGSCESGNRGCVTGIGGQGSSPVAAFGARDEDVDARFGVKVADPRIYVGVGYIFRNTNYEGGLFSSQIHGLGGGLEKLPDLERNFSLYGSAYYYPDATTNADQVRADGTIGTVQYRILKYGIGGTFDLGKTPVYLDFGYAGDRLFVNQNGPVDQTHTGPYAGLGIHF